MTVIEVTTPILTAENLSYLNKELPKLTSGVSIATTILVALDLATLRTGKWTLGDGGNASSPQKGQ